MYGRLGGGILPPGLALKRAEGRDPRQHQAGEDQAGSRSALADGEEGQHQADSRWSSQRR